MSAAVERIEQQFRKLAPAEQAEALERLSRTVYGEDEEGSQLIEVLNRRLAQVEADALLVPATDQVDPPWDEIMAEVRKARTQPKPPRPNPVLGERRKRHYAAGVRR